MVGLGPTIHEVSLGEIGSAETNSWMVVPSTTMTNEESGDSEPTQAVGAAVMSHGSRLALRLAGMTV